MQLVAVATADLRHPGSGSRGEFRDPLEDLDMAGAVHRLQRHELGLCPTRSACRRRCRGSRPGPRTYSRGTFAPVAGLHPEGRIEQLRVFTRRKPSASSWRRMGPRGPATAGSRSDARRSSPAPPAADGTGPSRAKLQVVALRRLLELVQIGGRLPLGAEGDTMDPLQHRPAESPRANKAPVIDISLKSVGGHPPGVGEMRRGRRSR